MRQAANALLIAPSFFGYEKEIAAKFTDLGWRALTIDERPSNSPMMRAVTRVDKRVLRRRILQYYRDWSIRLQRLEFDLIVVIKGEVVPGWFLEELRERSPNAKFVFYAYDALQNSTNCLSILSYFDRLLSFDRADVVRYPGFSYLPLFYGEAYAPLSPDSTDVGHRYSMSFVGTLHSSRFNFAKSLMNGESDTLLFLYVQARWYFALTKYLTRTNRSVRWSDVSFQPMSREDVADVFRRSRAVLDLPREGQVGLTMRTFEVLASGAILITTNSAVREEPFYDPRRVIVISTHPSADEIRVVWEALLATDVPAGKPPGFERYSLVSWVKAVVAA